MTKKVFTVVKDDEIKANGETDKGYELHFVRDDTRENRRSFADKRICKADRQTKTDQKKFINGESDVFDFIDKWNCGWHIYVYTKDEMIGKYKEDYDAKVDKARDEYKFKVDKLKREFAFEYLMDSRVKGGDNSDG